MATTSSAGFRLLWALIATCACATVSAGDIYRWVDEQGKLHISDRPPPNPPKNIVRQNSKASDISPEQQRQAAERAAREKANLRTMEGQRQQRETAQQAEPAAPASSAAAPVAASPGTCAARWEEWHRSTECYGPYRTIYGSLKAGALDACGPPVLDPSPQCGPGPQVTPTFAD